MVFTLSTFSSIAGNSRRGKTPVFHTYSTNDTQATVTTTPNYFAPMIQDLSVTDFIFVHSSVDGSFVLEVLNKGLNGIIDVGESMLSAVDSVFGRKGDVVALAGDYTASQVTNTPTGSVASTDLQGAIDELESEKLSAATPILDGNLNMNGNAIVDSNGNELLTFWEFASAVNNLEIWNAVSGSPPKLCAVGDDTNINMFILAKGDGSINLSSEEVIVSKANDTKLQVFSSANNSTLEINRFSNIKDARTVYATAGATTWLTGLEATPASFADDYTIKTTDGGNPKLVIQSSGRIGSGLGAASPTVDIERSSEGASFTSLYRHTGSVQHTLQSSGSNSTFRMFRGNPSNNAQILLGTGATGEWAMGMQFAPALLQPDFTIRRNSLSNPNLAINKSTGFTKIGESATAPLTSLHVERETGTCEVLTEALAGNATNTIKSTTTNAILNINRGVTAASCAIRLQQGAANIWQIGLDSSPVNLQDDFTIRRGAGFTPDMQIDKTNGWTKFGQNISSPTAPFHIWQQTTDCIVLAEGAGSADAVFRAQSGTGDAIIDVRRGLSNRDALVTYRTGATLEWAVGMDSAPTTFRPDYVIKTTLNGDPEFVFTTGGSLGIGTGGSEPVARLDVRDTNCTVNFQGTAGSTIVDVTSSESSRVVINKQSVTDECMTQYKIADSLFWGTGVHPNGGTDLHYSFKRSNIVQPDGYFDWANGGFVLGGASGGSQGNGTLNANAVYDDAVLLTCYVLEELVDGDVDLDKWNAIGTVDESGESKHIPANRFKETLTPYMDIEEYTKFLKANKHLPSFPSFEEYSKMSTGDLAQRLWETVEFQAVHNAQLLDRVKDMETKMQNLENKLSNLGV